MAGELSASRRSTALTPVQPRRTIAAAGPGAVLAAMEVLRLAGYLVWVSTGPPALPEPDTVLLMYREK